MKSTDSELCKNGLTFCLTQNISTDNLTWSFKVDEKSTYNWNHGQVQQFPPKILTYWTYEAYFEAWFDPNNNFSSQKRFPYKIR